MADYGIPCLVEVEHATRGEGIWRKNRAPPCFARASDADKSRASVYSTYRGKGSLTRPPTCSGEGAERPAKGAIERVGSNTRMALA